MANSPSKEQLRFCVRYTTQPVASRSHERLGISRDFDPTEYPINGVRYWPESGTCGWYLWSGEELSRDLNHFVALCVSHFESRHPALSKYLGLPPGWRFLVAPGYEDVWYDEDVLTQ